METMITVGTRTGTRRVRLADCLDGAGEEQARRAAHGWIKDLRGVTVDGRPMRRRFTFRDDSLWWFTELYLHKRRTILEVFRVSAALDHLVAHERPLDLGADGSSPVVEVLGPLVAERHGIRWRGGGRLPSFAHLLRQGRLDLRARALTAAARFSRARRPTPARRRPEILAFVHRAFWHGEESGGGAESYIGPVLQALEHEMGAESLQCVSVGPQENFSARRWWHPLRGHRALVPAVEQFAPPSALAGSARVWADRHANLRALCTSAELRAHSVVNGCDCWPLVRHELAGVAFLQWPWSARAMDQAAAALDGLRPSAVVTYAEAGGWGRALVLEARRRGIPSVGVQHGFIYRHWLNYLHEPDEMMPDEAAPSDHGFPYPDLTLLFDEYTADHLRRNGHFPPGALEVTGSPRLDALVAGARALPDAAVARARADAGASGGESLLLLVTKYREARTVLPALASAVASMPGVRLVIKTHPAETPDAYAAIAAGRPNIRVLPAAEPLAPLLRAARAVVTVNSTVAIDAAVLGVPSLVIGLPNNLSPFVAAGAMAGAATEADVGPAVRQILYDEGFRRELERGRGTVFTRFGIGSDGHAAARAAAAVRGLIGRTRPRVLAP